MLNYTKSLSLCLVMLLASCHPSSESIPGRYYERFNWGKVTLDLREDGTFVEEATLTDGTKRRIEGKWIFQIRDGETRVERAQCLGLGYERLEDETSACGQTVHSTLGFVEIALDPDHGYAYAKKN